MDNSFENIVPWNGANDDARDVRLKWGRNFAKIGLNFQELAGKFNTADEMFDLIAEELDKRLHKDKPDSTEFLLKLLAGIEAGEFVAGESGGKIDSSGDAEVRNLVARIKATVAALEAKTVTVSDKITTLNLLVQKLAETYDLNVSNVATLFRTIVKDYVSSESFVPGITGEGMKLYKALNGDWNLEMDNVVIRKAMTIFELIVSKVRSVNGGLVVSPANGRIKSVIETTGSPTYYVLGIEGDMTFVADDLVRCQVFSSTGAKYYWVPIDSVSGEAILILKSNFADGVVPAIGDDLVQMGNKTNTARQGVLYLTASEDGKPRFSVLDGVNSTDLTGKSKVILGCLDGITDSDFPSDAQPKGYGLWAGNVFLKGLFILRNGKSIEDELNDQITAVQTAFEIREGQISTKVTQATTAAQTATAKAGEAATSAGTASTKASEAAGSATTAGQKATDATNAANNAATILQTVTQKETNINQTADAIELKATRAEMAAGKAESAEASINLKADGIVLQASNKAAQTAVDGIKVGGRNLFRNSKCIVKGAISNVISNGATLSVDTVNTYLGESTMKVAGNIGFYWSYNPIIKPNTIYTISMMVKGNGSVAAGGATPLHIQVPAGGHNYENHINYNDEITTEWKQITRTFKSTATTDQLLRLYLYSIGSVTVNVAWVKLEEGTIATDYTSASEDVTADYTARIEVLNKEISSKVSQTAFDSLNGRVDTQGTAITQLPNTIDARITTQSQAGGIIKTQVESWFTLSGNTLSLGAKSVNITGATVFSSLATNDSVTNAINAVQVGGANLLPNSDFSNYVIDNSIGWDNALNGKYNISSWGSGFNGGVTSPTIGYHAHLNTTKFGFPVLEYINKNSAYGLAHRWMGISSGVYNKESLSPGQQYSFSADVMIDTSGMCIHGGIYSRKTGGTSYNFYSGQYTLVPTIINAWQRVSYIFILDKDMDLSGGVSFYIYGFAGTEGIAWVKNASLQLGTKGSFVRCDADITADAQNKANAAQTAAVTTARNNLATSLGYADYSAMEAQAIAGNTIINGGMIRTSLINAQAIVTGQLVANVISSTNITTQRLTVSEGCTVGGFEIGNNRIGISASPDNIGSEGMFLYPHMIGFNGSNMQAIIGAYSNFGSNRLGQFVNTTSDYLPNVGLVFDVRNVNNGNRNYAFLGNGNGVLNGYMFGYGFKEYSFAANNQYTVLGTLVSEIVYVYFNHSNCAIVLPTLASMCNTLGISYSTPFSAKIIVINTGGDGTLFGRATSGISGISGYQYPKLIDWNGSVNNDGWWISNGDSFQLCLYHYDDPGSGSTPASEWAYRAYIVNRQN